MGFKWKERMLKKINTCVDIVNNLISCFLLIISSSEQPDPQL